MGKQRRTQEQMETLRSAIYAVAQADRPVSIRHIFYAWSLRTLSKSPIRGISSSKRLQSICETQCAALLLD